MLSKIFTSFFVSKWPAYEKWVLINLKVLSKFDFSRGSTKRHSQITRWIQLFRRKSTTSVKIHSTFGRKMFLKILVCQDRAA